jgi:hypothetical protein
MSFGPVALDFIVQVGALLLHLSAFFFALHELRAKLIQFVVQSDELTHKFVFHFTNHLKMPQ